MNILYILGISLEPAALHQIIMETLVRISAVLLITHIIYASSADQDQKMLTPDEFDRLLTAMNKTANTTTKPANETIPKLPNRFLVRVPCKENYKVIRGECTEVFD